MRKILIGVLIVLVIGGITGGVIVFLQKQTAVSPLPTEQETKTKNLPSKTLKEYTDPSGFTFSYPDDLSIKTNEAEDDTVYADIQLTATEANGNLRVRIVDTKVKSIKEWLDQIPAGINTDLYKDAKLDELPAKEYKDDNGIELLALDQGVLFEVNVSFENNKDFWQKVYDNTTSTFSFAQAESGQSTTTSGSSSGSSSDIIFEGEEVIE